MHRFQHWGFTSQAERWNGRLAMLGFTIAIAIELITGQGVAQQLRALLP
jgi:Chlorophyll A-B binding protein